MSFYILAFIRLPLLFKAKKLLVFSCAMGCMMFPLSAEPALPFSTKISSMWLSGDKLGVLYIAHQRLQHDPNDLAGLILTLQYQMAFFDVANFKTTASKVIATGAGISTSNFSEVYPGLKASLLYLQQNMPSYSSQQIQAEAAKGNISGKPMELLPILQALEKDGLTH